MKLWITYAWIDNNDGNFDYLVQELAKAGIEAIFDKIALIPGQRLWEQIGNHILNGGYDGWAYLVTPSSLNSEPCKEELEYAVYRTLQNNSIFPLIGLIHGVAFNNLPASLRTRLCIELGNPNWGEQIKSALEKKVQKRIPLTQTKYAFKVSEALSSNGKKLFVVEIKPRFGELMYWRIAVPINTEILAWGFGIPDGTPSISGTSTSVITGVKGVEIDGISVIINGTGDRLSTGVAAKIIFENSLPSIICFGISNEQFGLPNDYECYKFY